MGRIHNIDQLPAAQHDTVLRCIRAHRYINVRSILADIKNQGVNGITSSSLSRYIERVKKADHHLAVPDGDTVITVLQRSTGSVQVIKTGTSAKFVVEMLSKI